MPEGIKRILYLFNSLWILCILWSIQLSWVYIRQLNGIQLPSTFNLYQRFSRVKEVLGVEGEWLSESRAKGRTSYTVRSMLVPSHCCPMKPMFERSLSPNKNHLLIVNLSACFLKLKIYITVNQHFCSCWADMNPAEASKLYVIPSDFIYR